MFSTFQVPMLWNNTTTLINRQRGDISADSLFWFDQCYHVLRSENSARQLRRLLTNYKLVYERCSYVYIVIISDYLKITGRVQQSHGSIANGLHTVMNNHTLQMGVKLFLIKQNFQSNGNVNSGLWLLEKTTNKIAFLFRRYYHW